MSNSEKNAKIESFGWYVLRTPLFPIAYIKQAQKATTPEDFKTLFNHELFKEAVYLASHQLYDRFERWLDGTIRWRKHPEKEEQKLIASLLKYWLRASYRCTPFGTMAGVSNPAEFINGATQIELGNIIRHTRLDAELLYTIDLQNPIQQLFPNPTIYPYSDNQSRYFYRYRKSIYGGIAFQYNFSSFENSTYIDKVLGFAASGKTLNELVDFLALEEIDEASAQAFIGDLLDAHILVSSQMPTVVGEDYQKRILGKEILQSLKITKKVSDYKSILHQFPKQVLDNVDRKFHIDCIRETKVNQLSQKVKRRVTKTVQLLGKMMSRQYAPELAHFSAQFYDRYGEGFVALNEVLDPDNGIKYPYNAIKEPHNLIHLPFRYDQGTLPQKIPNQKLQNFLLEIYTKALLHNQSKVTISADRITKKFANSEHEMITDSFGVLISVLPQEQIYLRSILQGGGSFLGRFGLASPAINQAIKEINEFEQDTNPDVIYAEIDHAPANPRAYNILNRPGSIRQYKIVLSSNPLAHDAEQVILASDLLITIQTGEIVLWSKKHHKRVIPKLTTAHNQRGSNYPLYNFLCDIANQKMKLPSWNWGSLASAPFLPRVEIDGVIVSPAKWKIVRKSDVEDFQVPDSVLLCESDNKLPLDLKSDWGQTLLAQAIDKLKVNRRPVILEENLFTDGQGFTNEVYIPFKSTQPIRYQADFFPKQRKTVQYLPGEEWVYVKLYLGVITAQEVIKNELRKLVKVLNVPWFFLRYRDAKGFHLRIRFQSSDTQLVIDKLNQVFEEYTQQGRIQMTYDTYLPEIKRYGGKKMMAICEQIFFYDSEAIIENLVALDQQVGHGWQMHQVELGTKNLTCLLADFGFTLEESITFIQKLESRFAKEFKVDKKFKKILSERIRDYQKIERADIGNDGAFEKRSKAIRPLIVIIKEKLKSEECITTEFNLFFAIVHMSLNRLFFDRPREHEFVCYNILLRRLQAQYHKNKKTT